MAESRTLSRVAASQKTASSTKKPSIAPAGTSFTDIGVEDWLKDTLKAMAIKEPTEIQRACIPPILAGKDVIGGAKTGSGKTAAFALPILQKLSEDPYGVFALVLTPTRELAFQIAEQFRVLGKGMGVKECVVVGGMGKLLRFFAANSVMKFFDSTKHDDVRRYDETSIGIGQETTHYYCYTWPSSRSY
jgi:ATP-dependent RNA helicase DDX49/DBP8